MNSKNTTSTNSGSAFQYKGNGNYPKQKLTRKERTEKAKRLTSILGQLDKSFSKSNDNDKNKEIP